MRLPIASIFTVIGLITFLGCGKDRETKEQGSISDNIETETKTQGKRIAVDVGLVVSNMEESLAFYHHLLGLPIVAKINTRLIGKGKMVQLSHGASLIKLVEFEELSSFENSKEISSSTGFRYITLMVNNIDEIKLKAEKNNLITKIPVTELDNRAKIFMVEDPDGNIVEFVQEPVD